MSTAEPITYKPGGAQLKAFMRDDRFFRGIRGPIGSGKSVACAMEIFRRAGQQAPGPDGIRRTRCAVIRNTNPQLKTTTIKTWLSWFPEEIFGRFMWSPPYTHHIRQGDIDLEVIFLALDKPEDIKKLLSLELTFCWINEAREVAKTIVDACTSRVRRFPSMKDGGPTWSGVWADTNSPEEDHWWPVMSGETPLPPHIPPEQALMLVKPDNWSFYTQPPGMNEVLDSDGLVTGYVQNPKAENGQHLDPKYYPELITGKTRSWIDVYILNKLGAVMDGRPVYASFNKAAHIAREPIPISPDLELLIGMDFGLTPAAIFAQRTPRGRWLFLRELVVTDMGAVRFAQAIKFMIATDFPDHLNRVRLWGDPAGDQRAQTDETTPFQIMRQAGLMVMSAPTNDPIIRVEAVTGVMERLVDGMPGFLVDPSCTVYIAGLEGGYHYRKLQVSGAGERYDTSPDKNRYSHVHDAGQYVCCGAGEARQVMTGGKQAKIHRVQRRWDVFDRKSRKARSDNGRYL